MPADKADRDTVDNPVRVQVLERTGVLDSPPEEVFDRLTETVCRALGVPCALVTLVDEDRQYFKSAQGLEEPWDSARETPLLYSFCEHVVERHAPLVVNDARQHPLVSDNPAIEELGVVAYAGLPLITSESVALGSFCAIDREPRDWDDGELTLLKALAQAAVTELELRQATRELMSAQQDLLDARDKAEKANAAKTEFLSRMSHELRTPLNAILGFAQLLEMEKLEPSQRESVDHIAQAGKHLLNLINELLDVARIEAGDVRPNVKPVELSSSLNAVIDLVEPLAKERNVTVSRPLATADDLWALADPTRLDQVLLNLLSNAVKYNQRDGHIDVATRTDSRSVTIVIADTGPGIPEGELDRLFEPFERLDRDKDAEGTGLGLSLARTLCQAMGANLSVNSREGEGTTCAIRLQPARSAVAGSERGQDPPDQAASGS